MVQLSSNVALFTFLIVIGEVSCGARTTRLKSLLQQEGNRGKFGDCFDAFDKCSKSEECREALIGLDEKCKVIDGHCGAEMVDLPRCGRIMDHVFSFGFPEEKCNCPQGTKECDKMLNKVYSNPCFASIRHLREHNLFPEEINAYDEVSGVASTTTSPLLTTKKTVKSDRPGNKFALFEEVFGDKRGTTISPTKQPKFVPFNDNNKVLRKSQGKSRIPNHRSKLRKEVTTKPRSRTEQTHQIQNTNKDNGERLSASEKRAVKVGGQRRKSQKQFSREPVAPVKGLTKDNSTDYKSIAIILAALLGAFVLSTVIFLLWARVKTSYLYTSGKFVQDQRGDEEIHQKMQSKFPENLSSMNPNAQV